MSSALASVLLVLVFTGFIALLVREARAASALEASRWSDEAHLKRACDALALDVDWDTVNAGALERASCTVKTDDGVTLIIAVISRASKLDELIADLDAERHQARLPAETPVRVYVPADFSTERLPAGVTVKRVT